MLHQLRYAATEGSRRFLLVACGIELPAQRAAQPLADATVWGSLVDCEDCREHSEPWPDEKWLKAWRKALK